MKRFLYFVQKEYFHIVRDYRSLIILLAMPPIMILLFGYAITNEIRNVKVAVIDQSKDQTTEDLKNKIFAGNYFIFDSELASLSQIEKTFRKGKVKEVIIFEPDFEENLKRTGTANMQLIADATDPNVAASILNYTSMIIRTYQMEMNEDLQIPLSIKTEVRMRYNEELRGAFLFVPGLITIILMLVSAMMTSISITREKELGTMEALLVSPMKPIQIILAKIVPYLILGVIEAVIILVVGSTVFGVPIRGSWLLLFFEGILFILTALSLGLLISTITDSQQTALMISLMGLMLPTMLLSGFIYPLANMPVSIQIFANFVPATWFNIAIKNIMLKGVGLEIIWKETLILLGFTIFFVSISLKKFKTRL